MTNEDDVLARLEKIGHQLDRQPKGRRIAREIGVVALFILLLAGLVTLPNILEPTATIGMGGLTVCVLIGIWIAVRKGMTHDGKLNEGARRQSRTTNRTR